jgi:predicted RNA-binding Zn-ribbon protein involved in translation (DUF1610 family)
MREVAITLWCDLCSPDDRQRGTTSYALTIQEVQPTTEGLILPPVKTLDLCDMHAKSLDELTSAVLEHGVRAIAVVRKRDDIPEAKSSGSKATPGVAKDVKACPACGYVGSNHTIAAEHLLSKHMGQGVATLRARRAADTACPECGVDFADSRAVAFHRKREHDRTIMDDALDAWNAANAGDVPEMMGGDDPDPKAQQLALAATS